jgi:hypothetical protein
MICDASPASRVSVSVGSFPFLEAFLGIFVPVVMVCGKVDLMGRAGGHREE